MHSLRLFLADDHEIVRYGLRNLLESQFGWTVVGEAADGREAVEKVLLLEPDVTLLDISMPRMNGLELLAHLRTDPKWKSLPVIMVTTEGSQNKVMQALELGANGYVRKPFTAEQIKTKLAGLV